jgi:2-polyprenyl-3-methyl-5-hydroxy-6-metoxy-1,4-benzoquinol methylase
MPFTAHNIRLSDGSETLPAQGYVLADTPTCISTIRTLNALYGPDLSGKSMVDLGCLEGGYAVEFARLGMDSLGIEVRQNNFDNCELVRRGLGLPNLRFVKDDVMNIQRHGTFDTAFCCGILYHLDTPVEFLRRLSPQTRRAIILHTCYAPDGLSETFPNLSEMTTNEDMPGKWYNEHTAETDESAEEHKWSSWRNQRSFWLTKPAIFQVLYNLGFRLIFEQMDWLGPDILGSASGGSYSKVSRVMIVGIR